MKKTLLLLLFGFSSLSMATTNHDYLFFQTSKQANIAKLHKNNYILTLDSLTDYVRYFTGKAKKKNGVVPLEKFISFWGNKQIKHNFADNPPNVIISMLSENGEKQQIIIAAVSNPGFAKGAVSYQISVLNHKQIEIGKFKHIVLFFDDIYLNQDEL